jgi:hypothetical protein
VFSSWGMQIFLGSAPHFSSPLTSLAATPEPRPQDFLTNERGLCFRQFFRVVGWGYEKLINSRQRLRVKTERFSRAFNHYPSPGRKKFLHHVTSICLQLPLAEHFKAVGTDSSGKLTPSPSARTLLLLTSWTSLQKPSL